MTKYQREQTKQSILYMCRLTFKTLTIGLMITYGLAYAFMAVKSAEAATLKPEALINSDVVKISDLFDDVPEKKDAVVGNAPAPGQLVILNARTLTRMANIYNIAWTSKSPADQVVVRSSAQTITTADITDLIKKDLEERGVKGKFGINLNNVAPSLTLPGYAEATAEITQMSYTAGRDVFSAVVVAPNAQNPLKSVMVSGTIEKTVSIPVLRTSVMSGDIIGSSDIEWKELPERQLTNDTMIDADKLIGKTPVRVVDAGVPVRVRDIVAPQMVARGDEVLIQFHQGGLQLTAKGKAMQNGAEGDYIRVMNLSSNQSLRAEVTGDKLVLVQ